MSKNVVAILLGGEFNYAKVPDDHDYVTYTNEKGAEFRLTIEQCELDGKTYFFARYSPDVTQQVVEKAIRQFI